MEERVLVDPRGEQVIVGVALIRAVLRGHAKPTTPQEWDDYRRRLITEVKVLAQDDPQQEARIWECYRAALHNQEPVCEIVQRIKDLAAQRRAKPG